MGLSVSHGDAQWSHEGFRRARRRLATALGVPIAIMEGFMGQEPRESAVGQAERVAVLKIAQWWVASESRGPSSDCAREPTWPEEDVAGA